MADKPIKLTRGVPAVESFRPLQLAECAQAVLLQHSDVVLQYGPSRGFAPLRELIAREAGVDPHRVLIGQGSLQLQDLCGRVMIRPGDVVYVEEPSYDRALTVLRRTGGQLVGFTLGESGPNVGEIEARLESGERPVLFYVIPDFQNPSGQVMPAETRRRIAALARQYDFYIIEDSPYRRLRYRGQDVPTIFEYAPERVLQMSSYSKLISPGLRVGYVIAPEALADRLARMAEDTYINPSYLNQAIAYEYERRGWLEPHIADLKALYRPRLDAMLDALARHMTGLGAWTKPDGGFFISLILHKNVHAKDLVHRAEQVNLQLTDGRGFFVASGGDRFVRLPFCALTPQEIEDGIARLADVVRAP